MLCCSAFRNKPGLKAGRAQRKRAASKTLVACSSLPGSWPWAEKPRLVNCWRQELPVLGG